jgi:SPP1 family predicted phage head-tail adaptor
MTIDAGSLRYLFSIYRRGVADDGGGGQESDWTLVDTQYGSLAPVSASQRFQAMKLEMSITHKIVMRWSNLITIDSDVKLVHSGREFNVRSVINVEERDRFIEIMADEGVVQ